MDLAWLTLAALAVVVVLSCAARINPGIVAIALAWLIAFYATSDPQKPAEKPQASDKPQAAKVEPLDLKSFLKDFPTEVFLTLLSVSLLFAQAEANGTTAALAGVAGRLARGKPAVLPIIFFLLALALGTAGPGNIAAAAVIAPLAMATARRTGLSPLVMALLVGHGAIATSVSPFSVSGATANTILHKAGIENVAWQIYLWNAAANAAAAVGGYLLFRGWRHVGASLANEAATSAAESFALSRSQWLTLLAIAAMIVAVVAGMPVGLAAIAAGTVVAALGLADERTTFQKIPWGVIVMVSGVSLLAGVMHRTGGTQLLAEKIRTVAAPSLLPALLAMVAGIVSVFSSTTGVVLPAFLPVATEVAANQPGVSALNLALAVLVGGNLVDMSPLSTIGGLCLAPVPDGDERRRLFNQLLIWGFAMALVGAVIAWLLF